MIIYKKRVVYVQYIYIIAIQYVLCTVYCMWCRKRVLQFILMAVWPWAVQKPVWLPAIVYYCLGRQSGSYLALPWNVRQHTQPRQPTQLSLPGGFNPFLHMCFYFTFFFKLIFDAKNRINRHIATALKRLYLDYLIILFTDQKLCFWTIFKYNQTILIEALLARQSNGLNWWTLQK